MHTCGLVFASRILPRPLEDQRPCGKVLCSFSFGPQLGLKTARRGHLRRRMRPKEARDGTQKWTKGNLEEVMLRGFLSDHLWHRIPLLLTGSLCEVRCHWCLLSSVR